jgi:hypothetical protein
MSEKGKAFIADGIIMLAVQRALERQRLNEETAKQGNIKLEQDLREKALQQYWLTCEGEPSEEAFNALWENGLKQDVINAHRAQREVSDKLRLSGMAAF